MAQKELSFWVLAKNWWDYLLKSFCLIYDGKLSNDCYENYSSDFIYVLHSIEFIRNACDKSAFLEEMRLFEWKQFAGIKLKFKPFWFREVWGLVFILIRLFEISFASIFNGLMLYFWAL